MTYALALSQDEQARYRLMADATHADEAAARDAAGVRLGAAVADVGCGPGAMLRRLAEEVGPLGRADGVDQAPDAVAAATAEVADLAQACARRGEATGTGLPLHTYDVVMCRHVLAHNGGRETEIVAHLAELARPGGAVYLVDVDSAALWMEPADPDVEDMLARYRSFQSARGNDLAVGRSLGRLLEAAGLDVERFTCGGSVRRVPPGMRGPAYAARAGMLAAGAATEVDIARWDAAFTRLDATTDRPWASFSTCLAVGRVPAGAGGLS